MSLRQYRWDSASIARVFLAILTGLVMQSVSIAQEESGRVDPLSDLQPEEPMAEEEEAGEPKKAASGERIEMLSKYDEALEQARLEQRPLLVILGAEWCGWCRKLEAEIDSDEGESILETWVVVKVDVDQEPEVAEKLAAHALPALRVLGTEENVVASTEGFMPIDELSAWLNGNVDAANPKIQRVLYQTAPPTEKDVRDLVAFLGNRSPTIRAAATERLVRFRSKAAGLVVDTVRNGKLSQRLAAIQVLQQWKCTCVQTRPLGTRFV